MLKYITSIFVFFIIIIASTSIYQKTENKIYKGTYIASILRCKEWVKRDVEFGVIGISEKTGTEYIYGFYLEKHEIPKSIIKKYLDIWGTEKFLAHRLILSFPVENISEKPTIQLPIQFFKVATKKQKNYLNPKHLTSSSNKLSFWGYEYQAILSNGKRIRLPYFSIIRWSDRKNSDHTPKNKFFDFDNSYFIEKIDLKNLPKWILNQPWDIPKKKYCKS